MATSPHQPESLAEEITRLKAELAELRQARSQILVLGQATAGGGTSTTYANLADINLRIDALQAVIRSKVDQLNGDADNLQPGVNLLSHRSEYA